MRLALVTLMLLLVPAAGASAQTGDERAQLRDYAHDTWESFVAMTDPSSGERYADTGQFYNWYRG